MVYSYSLKTRRREELIDITDYVRDSIKKNLI